jgi:DNA-binding response OmpR family regulator
MGINQPTNCTKQSRDQRTDQTIHQQSAEDDGGRSYVLYIHYLRQKIEDQPKKPYYLLAEWGYGYRLRPPSP